jgi:hypothetical protein
MVGILREADREPVAQVAKNGISEQTICACPQRPLMSTDERGHVWWPRRFFYLSCGSFGRFLE